MPQVNIFTGENGIVPPNPAFTNPYLALTVMLDAGLDGIDNSIPCPEPLNDGNVYELTEAELKEMDIRQLPGTLGEALTEMEKDPLIKDALGDALYESFIRAKSKEWKDYNMTVTDWEVKHYLETA